MLISPLQQQEDLNISLKLWSHSDFRSVSCYPTHGLLQLFYGQGSLVHLWFDSLLKHHDSSLYLLPCSHCLFEIMILFLSEISNIVQCLYILQFLQKTLNPSLKRQLFYTPCWWQCIPTCTHDQMKLKCKVIIYSTPMKCVSCFCYVCLCSPSGFVFI